MPGINNRPRASGAIRMQKPLALLERIIQVSSNEGDLVLDPFCGCGKPTCCPEARSGMDRN